LKSSNIYKKKNQSKLFSQIQNRRVTLRLRYKFLSSFKSFFS